MHNIIWNVNRAIEEIEAGRTQNALSYLSFATASETKINPSIDTMRDFSKSLILKNGWKAGDSISLYSAIGLMAEFGMQVYRGEVGCDYPSCGCCADAACEDAIKQHQDFGVNNADS